MLPSARSSDDHSLQLQHSASVLRNHFEGELAVWRARDRQVPQSGGANSARGDELTQLLRAPL
jgi:hypothetical protein